MRRIIFGLSLLAALLASAPAPAQNTTGLTVATCGSPPTAFTATRPGPFTVDTGGQLCITGSISASLSGFAPATQGTPVAATIGGNTQTLPVGAVVVATNIGTTNAAYCRLGASATTDSQYIAPNGGWFAFTVGANTQLTCVTSTSTTTVNTAGGAGLPTGTGGGGGSGGGGGGAITAASGSYASGALSSGSVASGAFASGSVASGAYASGSIASGAMVDLGAIADAAATAGSTGSVSAKLRLATTQLATLNTTLNAPFQAGGSIGNTAFIANAGTNLNTSALSTSANQTNGTQQTQITDGTNIAAVTAASTAPTPAQKAVVVAMSPNVSYTFYTNSATGTTGATTATLAGAASVTTYICGFSIRANATAAATGNATVTGTISGTLNFTQWTAPNASGVGVTEMIFSPCIPASATNTSIAVVSAAPGTGGVVSSTAWGYKL